MTDCPYCEPHRSRTIIDANQYGYHVLCQSCGAQGPVATDADQAEIFFNTPPRTTRHYHAAPRLPALWNRS